MADLHPRFQGIQKKCTECGKTISESEALVYENKSICSACKPIFIQKLKEGLFNEKPDFRPENVKFAGFWFRAAAKIIDILIIYAVAMTTLGGLNYIFNIEFSQYESSVLILSLFFAYNALLIGSCGATLGKIVFRIKVISSDGKRVGHAATLKRQIAEICSVTVFLLGYIIVVFDGQKRALHDYYGRTWVVKR